MSHALKSNYLSAVIARANLLQDVRAFFKERQVMEVETPLLRHSTTADPHIQSLYLAPDLNTNIIHQPTTELNEKANARLYLQTSPEFAMKKLLADGAGCIYQLCKAFRQDPAARYHHPEFTLLEWYRVGFDHHQLMSEIEALLQLTTQTSTVTKVSYQAIFEQHLNLNPHSASLEALKNSAKSNGIQIATLPETRDIWLDLLFSHLIQPKLLAATFIYDYPASQAALAKIREDTFPVAERFELFIQGIELANGYHELCDATEQQQRFAEDNLLRKKLGLPTIATDTTLTNALKKGLPPCAGVALGIDRLLMLIMKATHLSDVLCLDDHPLP